MNLAQHVPSSATFTECDVEIFWPQLAPRVDLSSLVSVGYNHKPWTERPLLTHSERGYGAVAVVLPRRSRGSVTA
jgi:hypothetical protein